MVVFVLVHGTGHGGWCWRFLVPLLRKGGYDVCTPTLTGLGASSHLAHELNRISLGTHVKDITNMLFYDDLSDVVLVGHSYGGMVITGVAAKESQRLAHLIYLDAYLPFEGENEVALWPPVQKERYLSDIASGIKFRSPLESSVLGITDPECPNGFKKGQHLIHIVLMRTHLPPVLHKPLLFLELIFTVHRGRFHHGWNHLLQGPESLGGKCIPWPWVMMS